MTLLELHVLAFVIKGAQLGKAVKLFLTVLLFPFVATTVFIKQIIRQSCCIQVIWHEIMIFLFRTKKCFAAHWGKWLFPFVNCMPSPPEGGVVLQCEMLIWQANQWQGPEISDWPSQSWRSDVASGRWDGWRSPSQRCGPDEGRADAHHSRFVCVHIQCALSREKKSS